MEVPAWPQIQTILRSRALIVAFLLVGDMADPRRPCVNGHDLVLSLYRLLKDHDGLEET